MISGLHIGREWTGHDIEDQCPCPKEPCGLVDTGRAVDDCSEHVLWLAKGVRQAHNATDCPGPPDPPKTTEETDRG